jgi:hypothetical protein
MVSFHIFLSGFSIYIVFKGLSQLQERCHQEIQPLYDRRGRRS